MIHSVDLAPYCTVHTSPPYTAQSPKCSSFTWWTLSEPGRTHKLAHMQDAWASCQPLQRESLLCTQATTIARLHLPKPKRTISCRHAHTPAGIPPSSQQRLHRRVCAAACIVEDAFPAAAHPAPSPGLRPEQALPSHSCSQWVSTPCPVVTSSSRMISTASMAARARDTDQLISFT